MDLAATATKPRVNMRIVVIEDNLDLARGIMHRLRDNGHAVDHLMDGREAATFLARDGADIVVLDINLPGLSGLDVLRGLRARGDQSPVLLLTARGDTADRVAGLDAGADDYLVKPFAMDELMARLRALARRRATDARSTLHLGPLVFDMTARCAKIGEQVLDLPRKELAALECLLERRTRLTPKSELVDHLYGVGADVDESVVEVHISRLRKRLRLHGFDIKTARGLGYMLTEPG